VSEWKKKKEERVDKGWGWASLGLGVRVLLG